MKFIIILSLICASLLPLESLSQGYPLKQSEIVTLKKRPLIVEMLSELPRTEENKNQNIEIASYNDILKKSVNDFWFDNGSVEFKTNEEVEVLRAKGSTKYSVLYLSMINRRFSSDFVKQEFFQENEIRMINFSKIEETKRPSYSFMVPDLGKNKSFLPSNSQVVLSIKMIKNHIEETQSNGKKLYNFKKYSKDQASKNCSEIENNTLCINETLAFKVSLTLKKTKLSISDYTKALKSKNVEIISSEEIDEKILAGTDDLISIALPESIAISRTASSLNRKIYYRVFVNANTGKIYSYAGATSTDNTPYFSTADMKAVAKCN